MRAYRHMACMSPTPLCGGKGTSSSTWTQARARALGLVSTTWARCQPTLVPWLSCLVQCVDCITVLALNSLSLPAEPTRCSCEFWSGKAIDLEDFRGIVLHGVVACYEALAVRNIHTLIITHLE